MLLYMKSWPLSKQKFHCTWIILRKEIWPGFYSWRKLSEHISLCSQTMLLQYMRISAAVECFWWVFICRKFGTLQPLDKEPVSISSVCYVGWWFFERGEYWNMARWYCKIVFSSEDIGEFLAITYSGIPKPESI